MRRREKAFLLTATGPCLPVVVYKALGHQTHHSSQPPAGKKGRQSPLGSWGVRELPVEEICPARLLPPLAPPDLWLCAAFLLLSPFFL